MAHRSNGEVGYAVARGLGWFSIGLGLAELVVPGRLARALGMEEQTELIRVYGLRELAAGIGILARDDPTPWLWGRVGGDVLDLGTLAIGLGRDNPRRQHVGLAIAAVAGVTLVDVLCAQALGRASRQEPPLPLPDYSTRRGMPRPPAAMRGAARDFPVPRDMRIPEALRPFPTT